MLPSSLRSLADAHAPAPLPAPDRVADVLREQIVDGRLDSGVRLTEEVVAEHLDVSRNTVREAFLILASQGLVVRRANRGVFVAEPSLDLVRDLYAVRLCLEPSALLWGHLTPRALERLHRAVDEADAGVRADDVGLVRSRNQEFHRAIVDLAESERTRRWFSTCLAEMWLVFNAIGEQRDFHAPYVARNRAILELLEAGRRPEAAEALRAYLSEARDDLLGRLGPVLGRSTPDAGALR